MPNVVIDASTIVGAALKRDSVPEKALLLARATATFCLSAAVEAEIRDVLRRPKFRRFIRDDVRERILDIVTAAALIVEPDQRITDCRDRKDNIYPELALAAKAVVIVSSDHDLLSLDPWRGIRILRPRDFLQFLPGDVPPG
jgi:putative PIN family toxin of toxin-antitoxin system